MTGKTAMVIPLFVCFLLLAISCSKKTPIDDIGFGDRKTRNGRVLASDRIFQDFISGYRLTHTGPYSQGGDDGCKRVEKNKINRMGLVCKSMNRTYSNGGFSAMFTLENFDTEIIGGRTLVLGSQPKLKLRLEETLSLSRVFSMSKSDYKKVKGFIINNHKCNANEDIFEEMILENYEVSIGCGALPTTMEFTGRPKPTVYSISIEFIVKNLYN